jgi:non-ribosomal peptide synthetase component F
VCDLPLLTEAERQQILVSWNDTRVPYPAACLHRLIEAQVKRTPEAIALLHPAWPSPDASPR